MALILVIETATKNCSLALCENGITKESIDYNDGNFSHAEKLHVFIGSDRVIAAECRRFYKDSKNSSDRCYIRTLDADAGAGEIQGPPDQPISKDNSTNRPALTRSHTPWASGPANLNL